MEFLNRLTAPGAPASLAALLIAIGIEVPEPILKHVFDILGGLVALLGLVF